ncbi:hypothetical protein MKW92_045940, partial [Papaver armeniacum]
NPGRGTSRGFNRGGRTSNAGRGFGRGNGILPSPSSSSHIAYPTSVPRPSSFNSISSGERPTCKICHKYGHAADECWNIINFSYEGRNPPRNLQAMLASANVM